MPTPRPLTSRRTVIGLALAVPLTLAACELDPPTDPAAGPPSGETTAEPVPDAELVSTARTAILTTMASVEAAIAAHRRLRPALTPWVRLHSAHLEVLDEGSSDGPVEAQPMAGTASALSELVLQLEADLATALADAAQRAASGDLARALASMSAALRQRALP